MPVQVRAPTTWADDAGTGTVAWTNPGNASADDGTNTVANLSNSTTHYLKGTVCGFASEGTPIEAGDTVNSITVRVKRFQNGGTGTIKDFRLSMFFGGAVDSQNLGDTTNAWPGSETEKSYTFTTGLPTPTQILATDFGFVLSAIHSGGGGAPATVDFGSVEINFTEAAPPTNIDLTQDIFYYSSFAPTVQQSYELDLSLSHAILLSPAMGMGQDTNIELPFSTLHWTGPPWEVTVETRLELSQSIRSWTAFDIQFALEINLSRSVLKWSSFASTLEQGFEVNLAPSTRRFSAFAPSVIVGTEMDLSLSMLKFLAGPLYSYLVTPHAKVYLEAVKSSVTQVILGVTNRPFKLDHAMRSRKKRSHVNVLHTGKAKHDVRETLAVFTILNPYAEMDPGEFHYESTNHLLRIVNEGSLSAMLVADGNHDSIPITQQTIDITSVLFVTGFYQD